MHYDVINVWSVMGERALGNEKYLLLLECEACICFYTPSVRVVLQRFSFRVAFLFLVLLVSQNAIDSSRPGERTLGQDNLVDLQPGWSAPGHCRLGRVRTERV